MEKNSADSKQKSDIRQLPARIPKDRTIMETSGEGTSEFYYKPENDTRVWHVLNTYSQFSKHAPEYNFSEYLFTSDSVIVKNHYVGIETPASDR